MLSAKVKIYRYYRFSILISNSAAIASFSMLPKKKEKLNETEKKKLKDVEKVSPDLMQMYREFVIGYL